LSRSQVPGISEAGAAPVGVPEFAPAGDDPAQGGVVLMIVLGILLPIDYFNQMLH
jgi:hypothetical protein